MSEGRILSTAEAAALFRKRWHLHCGGITLIVILLSWIIGTSYTLYGIIFGLIAVPLVALFTTRPFVFKTSKGEEMEAFHPTVRGLTILFYWARNRETGRLVQFDTALARPGYNPLKDFLGIPFLWVSILSLNMLVRFLVGIWPSLHHL